jgi:hypothetical protein
MPSNSNLYTTTESCATFGLSVGCTVIAANGWYYDNNTGYSYYISNNSNPQVVSANIESTINLSLK